MQDAGEWAASLCELPLFDDVFAAGYHFTFYVSYLCQEVIIDAELCSSSHSSANQLPHLSINQQQWQLNNGL